VDGAWPSVVLQAPAALARYSRRDGHIRLSAQTRHAGRWE
jgi:hypothetical protein